MKQKFKRGSRVKYKEKIPVFDWKNRKIIHEERKGIAIVQYTYGQKFKTDNYKSYSLVLLDKNDNAYNSKAWIDESKIELINENITEGLKIIEEFNYGEK